MIYRNIAVHLQKVAILPLENDDVPRGTMAYHIWTFRKG